MNMPIFLAVFFIGCMTITAFIALIIWVAFFEPKNDDYYEKTHRWIAVFFIEVLNASKPHLLPIFEKRRIRLDSNV
jgi:hypothetical protein